MSESKKIIFADCEKPSDFTQELWRQVCAWLVDDKTPRMDRINTVKAYSERFQDGKPCNEERFHTVLRKLKDPLSPLFCIQDVHDIVFPNEGRVKFDSLQLDEVARMMVYRMERIMRGDGFYPEAVPQVYKKTDPMLAQTIDDLLERPIRPADILRAYADGHNGDSYVNPPASEDEQMAWAMQYSTILDDHDTELQQALQASNQAYLDSLPDCMME